MYNLFNKRLRNKLCCLRIDTVHFILKMPKVIVHKKEMSRLLQAALSKINYYLPLKKFCYLITADGKYDSCATLNKQAAMSWDFFPTALK